MNPDKTSQLDNRIHDQGFFTQHRWVYFLVLAGLFLLGLGLRLSDLDDPPLEYHPTRQLRSAIIARAIYYQIDPHRDPDLVEAARKATGPLETLEPPIFESIVAGTYRLLNGEQLWIPRLYSIFFWMVGGVALYDLARRMSGGDGALAGLAYYMVLPFAVVTSRTFQPDSAMVMFIILGAWAIHCWSETLAWRWAVAAGLLSGFGVLIKVPALLPLAIAGSLAAIGSVGVKNLFRNVQVWMIFFLMLAPAAIYYLVNTGSSSSGYFQFWNMSFSHLLLQPRFYVLWVKFLDNLMNLALILGAAVGILLMSRGSHRLLVVGWWFGYFIYGLFFPFQINTHEYYSLMFVPAVALGLAAVSDPILAKASLLPRWRQFLLLLPLTLALAFPSWIVYSGMKGVDSRPDELAWQRIGQALPQDGEIVALTDDYGTRILYYGMRVVDTWPLSLDFNMQEERDPDFQINFDELFEQKTSGKDYFLITAFTELENQPQLEQQLFENYSVYSQGDGYIIFDLRDSQNP